MAAIETFDLRDWLRPTDEVLIDSSSASCVLMDLGERVNSRVSAAATCEREEPIGEALIEVRPIGEGDARPCPNEETDPTLLSPTCGEIGGASGPSPTPRDASSWDLKMAGLCGREGVMGPGPKPGVKGDARAAGT